MKKKELLKRLSAISMAAMMTVTAVPANTFAADIEFSDGEAETAEAQEDSADISVEEDPAVQKRRQRTSRQKNLLRKQ